MTQRPKLEHEEILMINQKHSKAECYSCYFDHKSTRNSKKQQDPTKTKNQDEQVSWWPTNTIKTKPKKHKVKIEKSDLGTLSSDTKWRGTHLED